MANNFNQKHDVKKETFLIFFHLSNNTLILQKSYL